MSTNVYKLARVCADLFSRLSPIQRSFASAMGGFLLYGAWAITINSLHGHGREVALLAGLVQGSFSFVVTFLMTIMIELAFRLLLKIIRHVGFAALMTVLVSCAVLFASSWYVNVIFGTPEILQTVILGYILGGIYSVVYTVGLSRTPSTDGVTNG